jgi:CRISP-associated protein Cas1
MIKKTLYFQSPCHLKIKDLQLVVTRKDTGEVVSRPVEDLGVVLLDHQQITLTQSTLQLMAEHNVAVIVCDTKHHPKSMLLHLDSHQTETELFRYQINAGLPLKKKLWQQTVKQKIRNQASLLDWIGKNGAPLRQIAKKVKSGDSENHEAMAARLFWPLLFADDFQRRRVGPYPNNLLNYGYALLRSGIAKALMGSGLLPTLGIHHRNKYNSFCLADDIMEPYRPFVDMMVFEMWENGQGSEILTNDDKKNLLSIFVVDVAIGELKRPLMDALSQTTASLARCFSGQESTIRYPVL